MRLKITESKNAKSLYVIKSVYQKATKSNTSKIVEKLGTYEELKKKLNGEDPIEWAKKYVEELNRKEKEKSEDIMVRLSPMKPLEKERTLLFNGGYLFLQKIYYEMGLNKLTADISLKYKIEYDLDSILSRLLYSRIIYPSSKRSTCELSSRYIEAPDFSLHQVYRALEVLCKESDYIQAVLYKNSAKIIDRKKRVLYYDCTNYYFEIDEADGLKQYGIGKENRPNPIVQMGLFMDEDGIPLAFDLSSGNTNEQVTLKPLEKKILSEFELSKFVVCTDSGLSSHENRKLNDVQGRAFVTTQSLKKLPAFLTEWALDTNGWRKPGDNTLYNLDTLDEEEDKNTTFYKERWIKEKDLEQRLIVSFSLKYRNYHRNIREKHIIRAERLITKTPGKLTQARQTDYKRLINQTHVTLEGEIAKKVALSIDEDKISSEAAYDGFYAVCTNLEDDVPEIIRINKMRWQIEECFRIMKSELKVRPVHLKREDRIRAHFLTCFMALLLYRIVETKLGKEFSSAEINRTLREMNFYKTEVDDYIPAYTRTKLTDSLHEAFEFRTDFQILPKKSMKKILKGTKTGKSTRK